MKNTLTLLLLTCMFLVNAQVTEIFVPNTTNGASIPFYQRDGFIYTYGYYTNGNTYLKINKINQITNQVTEIQEDTNVNSLPLYIGSFNEKLLFGTNIGTFVLNPNNNTFNYFAPFGPHTPAVQGNYYYNEGLKYDINTGVSSYVMSNNNIYLSESYYNISGDLYNLFYNKIYKKESSSAFSLLYTAPNETYINTLWGNNQSLFKLGNKLIFNTMSTSGTDSNLVGLTDSGTLNTITTSNTPSINQQLDQFIYNGNLYYYENTDDAFMKKTDGTSANITTIANPSQYGNNNFSSWYYPSKNFIEYQGNMYSMKYGASNEPRYFVKFDGTTITNLTTELTDIQSAMIHNNIMYFKGGYLNGGAYFIGIFSFDGNTIRKLDLGTTFADVTLGSSLYGYNNYLFFSNGYSLVKVDLNTVSSTVFSSTLSTQETPKPIIKLYPNPTKSQLNFSEELSEIKIVDMSGKQVATQKEKSKTINVEKLPKGNYLISAKDKNGKTVSEKFIKE